MHEEHEAQPWDELEQLAREGDAGQVGEYVDELSPPDAARTLARMPDEEQTRVLTTLSPEDAADLIEEIPEAQAVDLIEHLPAADAAVIVAEMDSDEQADLLGALSAEDAEAVLSEMEPEEAADVRRLASYPPEVAGGLMITEYLCWHEAATVREVIDDLHARAEEYAGYDVQYAYVVAETGALTGVLPLRNLLLAPPSRSLSAVMIHDPISVRDDDDLESLDSFFKSHAFLGAPVVDSDGMLVGVVRRVDVESAIADRAGTDFLKAQGIVGGEELRTMRLARRSSRRLSWLSINILLNVVAASVIAMYQDTLSAVIALAVFLPIISDMSGCSGNQASAVSMRELSLGLVRPQDLLYVWLKELSVGLINGCVLGLILGAVAWLWKGNAYLGLVAGGALAVNTMVAVSIGGLVPLVLRRLGFDPALASGPVLTTVTDLCGFFFVLSFATMLLPKLVI